VLYAAPAAARPPLAADPARNGLIVMRCVVRIEDPSFIGQVADKLSRGILSRFTELDADVTLAGDPAAARSVRSKSVHDQLVFVVPPGRYRVESISANVGPFVPSEAQSRDPVWRYGYGRNDSWPDSLEFLVAAGEVKYLGTLFVDEPNEPKVGNDASIEQWQSHEESYRLVRSARMEEQALGELARIRKSAWGNVLEARMHALEGAADDSLTLSWR
jgi:hypothetical protein